MTSRTAPISEQTSNRAIAGVVRRIGTAGKAFNDVVQEGGLMVLAHVAAYRDCTGAARIIDAMPKTTRRSLLVAWFREYGGINVGTKEGKVTASLYKEGSANHLPRPNIEGAKMNPWHVVKEAEKNTDLYTIEDMNDSINRLIVRVGNMVERTEKNANEGQRVAAGDVESLKAQLAALKALVNGDTNDNEGSSNEPVRATA